MIGRIMEHLIPRNLAGDTFFSWLMYLKNHRRIPNSVSPASFSDHLFKVKSSGELYNPLRQLTSDKVLVKHYVEYLLGGGFTPRTISVICNEQQVDEFEFSSPCVIKAAHASQLVKFVADERVHLDKEELKRWLRLDHYRMGREANYRYLGRRLIVEELLRDSDSNIPKDFKLFCFYGEPQIIQVDADRFTNHTRNFYSTKWDFVPFTLVYPNHQIDPKPNRLHDMVVIARTVAAPFSFVRVDLYVVGGKVYIGELTHLPENGKGKFYPKDFDFKLSPLFTGKMLEELDLD